MTSQSHFEGMDPVLGRMHEQTFNIALAIPFIIRPATDMIGQTLRGRARFDYCNADGGGKGKGAAGKPFPDPDDRGF